MPSDAPASEPPPADRSKPRRYRAPGREEQKRETRERILHCALIDFSQRGFDAASLRDIAAEAQVSFAAIQKHFGTKDALWRAAIDEMFARQEEELGSAQWAAAERATPADLREFIHRYVRYCARHPEHVRITVHESLRDTERVRWITERHIKKVHEPFVRLFERSVEDGWLPDIPAISMLYILTSAAGTMFALGAEVRHVYGIDVHDPAVVEAHAAGLSALILKGN